MYYPYFMKFKTLLANLLVLIVVSVNALGAVAPPQLRCVSVNAVGNATLTWLPPSDPGNEFLNYEIFVSNTIGGPYTSVVVTGLASTQYSDLVNDANVNSYYYFIQSVFNDGSGPVSSVSSDTGKTMLPIFMTVSDSTNIISWDPVFNPDLPTSGGTYDVFRRIGTSGIYSQIASTPYGTELNNDTFKVCSDMISYRIDISDGSGCVSSSAILADLFEDNTPPATPVYDSITVDGASQEVNLGWKASTSPDTRGYIILYWIKATSSYVIRDTVMGINNTSYAETLLSIDPGDEFEQYTVSAFDSCFHPNANTSPAANEQRTIHLKIIPNNCENTVTLQWTPYINWTDLDGYEILVSVNGDPYQSALTLSATDTSYTHQKTNDLAIYCYKIRAFNTSKSKTTTSNIKCSIANSLVIPSRQYFKKVTVVENKSVHIESLTDTTLPVNEYVLYRSLEKINNFFEVNRIPFANSPIIEMNDFEANVDETSYFYRVGIIDTCGSLMFISNAANTIFLEGSMDDDSLDVTLQWNDYIGWDSVGSGVGKYLIYRLVDGKREVIDSVDRFITRYTYPIKENVTLGANFCFEIEAIEADGNKYLYSDTALSNQICFTKNLNVFVPTAFRPGGANPVFTPVISFGELASYQMVVYDRWGSEVFKTTNIDQGWDGTVNGNESGFGAYVYFIQISNFTGASYQKRGTVILLR